MNWIKNNPFVATLAGITLVLCAALFYLGSKGSGKYEDAKTSFDESYQSVQQSESIALYPKAELRDGKRKALGEYVEAVDTLITKFDNYRPDELANVSPQDFTASLKQASKEVTAALKDAGSEVPEGFLMGYQRYGNEFATEKATGVLNYQLQGIKHALMQLAKSRPSALLNVYREEIPEENGETPVIGPDQVMRTYGVEIAFKGSEASVRAFLNSLGETTPYYYIVRTLKVLNENDKPPQVSDAKFERTSTLAPAAPEVDNPFGDAFVLPGAEQPEDQATPSLEEPAADAEEPLAEETSDPADSSRILASVLGSEELIVFVRFDLTMFLQSKELPKP